MKILAISLFCCISLTMVSLAQAAEPVIHVYPDKIVVELIDCSTQAPAAIKPDVKTTSGLSTASQSPSSGDSAAQDNWQKSYREHLQDRMNAVQNRLAQRQARWEAQRATGR